VEFGTYREQYNRSPASSSSEEAGGLADSLGSAAPAGALRRRE